MYYVMLEVSSKVLPKIFVRIHLVQVTTGNPAINFEESDNF